MNQSQLWIQLPPKKPQLKVYEALEEHLGTDHSKVFDQCLLFFSYKCSFPCNIGWFHLDLTNLIYCFKF